MAPAVAAAGVTLFGQLLAQQAQAEENRKKMLLEGELKGLQTQQDAYKSLGQGQQQALAQILSGLNRSYVG